MGVTYPWETPVPAVVEPPQVATVVDVVHALQWCKKGHLSHQHSDGSCAACRNESGKKWRQSNPEKTAALELRSRIKNRARRLITSAKYRAEKKKLPFDLSEHVAYYQSIIDAGKCQLTGLPFGDFDTSDAPSLDRIEPSKGYVKDNVRVVLWAVNAGLGDWGVDKFKEISHALHRETTAIVVALQNDLRYAVSHTAVQVNSSHDALQMLVNTPRGQIIPRGECKLTDGSTIEFQDIGMPQVGAPVMTVKELMARVWEVVTELGLGVQ